MAVKYPSIPDPSLDPTSLRQSIVAIKEALEILMGQRGDGTLNAVNPAAVQTVSDTVDTNSSNISTLQGNVTTLQGGHYVYYDAATNFTAQQYFGLATITDAANLAWTVSTGQKAKVTLGGNRTMNAVTGAIEGASYFLWVIQDGTGSRTITWTTSGAGSFDFGTAGAPTLTTTASKADLLGFEAVSIGGTLKLRFTGCIKGFA